MSQQEPQPNQPQQQSQPTQQPMEPQVRKGKPCRLFHDWAESYSSYSRQGARICIRAGCGKTETKGFVGRWEECSFSQYEDMKKHIAAANDKGRETDAYYRKLMQDKLNEKARKEKERVDRIEEERQNAVEYAKALNDCMQMEKTSNVPEADKKLADTNEAKKKQRVYEYDDG